MGRLIVFNQVSVDGYIADTRGDMSWAHKDPGDREWNEFVSGNASGDGVLLFGRVTYDMMAAYWPTPEAARDAPLVAQRMNARRKVVFSRSLTRAAWANTRLVKSDLAGEVREMKKGSDGLAILGSARITAQLAQEGLIDEYDLVVSPVVLGGGKSMFDGVTRRIGLKLARTRVFGNGAVMLCYVPA